MQTARAWGVKRREFLDFSVSLNPLGPPEAVLALPRDPAALTRYPDPRAAVFKSALSEHLAIDPDCLVAANGSTEIIYLLPHLLKPGSSVLIVAPCFSEYEKAFRTHGIDVHFLELTVENDFHLDPDRLKAALASIPEPGAVILGHPNSPCGHLCDADTLRSIAKYCEERKILLVVDECFWGVRANTFSLAQRLPEFKNLVLIRSITKLYSIPGVRLGYALMPVSVRERLEKFLPPWTVSDWAQEIGRACLSDLDFIERSRGYLIEESRRVTARLESIPLLRVFPTESCFILMKFEGTEQEAEYMFLCLLRKGIVLRNCGNFRGLDRRFFRMGIRSRKDNDLCLQALEQLLC